jgi:MFS transporter, FSR family, fosmidomycin resistance protein
VVKVRVERARPRQAGAWVLAAALAVVLVDELVDGAKNAALPLMRTDLRLTYGQIGLLASVPLLLGSVLELPLGVVAGHGRRRRLAVLGGGAVFILALAIAATARSFAGLLVAFVLFFPASGAFVSLTQSGLMDADPGRREQHMARWELAGSVGSVTGPVVLVAVLGAGGGWRSAYLVLALAALLAWLGVIRAGRETRAAGAGRETRAAGAGRETRAAGAGRETRAAGAGRETRSAVRRAIGALRQPGVVRWLTLIQVCDLLLDIFTGFLGLYLVDVVHATSAQAAVGVAIRLATGLAGDVVLVGVLERVGGLGVLRASTVAATLLYPGFLLVPGLWPKLVLLGCLSVVTAPWYPLLQAQLYRSLPDESGVVVTLSSAATLIGGTAPLAVGLLAQRLGLGWALTSLVVVAPCLLAGLWHTPKAPPPSRDGGSALGTTGS